MSEPINAADLVPLVLQDFVEKLTPPAPPPAPPHPRAIPIRLDPEQSEILTDAGGDAFLVIDKETYPGDPKRWVIHLVPCSINAGNAAIRVARGISAERKTRTPKA